MREDSWVEVQIDRLVGPTHHFGGLGVGNVASQLHAGEVSNPAAAARQGLEKMRLVAGYGVPQWILPPQPRPHLDLLESAGFQGSNEDALAATLQQAPKLLSAAMSSSAMWMANAATVTVNPELQIVLTIANLDASVHRAIEPSRSQQDLERILPLPCRLLSPLIGGAAMRDEGAANHMRLSDRQLIRSIDVLVYGDQEPMPSRHWPRQTRHCCESIARRHGLPPQNVFLLKQHPRAIDAGAFHNDVVAMSHQNLLIRHQWAYAESDAQMQQIERRFKEVSGRKLIRIEVPDQTLSLQDAVETYLFNSQIISPAEADRKPVLIAPVEVQQHQAASQLVDSWCSATGIFERVEFVDLGQSMFGGGGPACLRLRVPMPASQIAAMPAASRWSDQLDERLQQIIDETYPSSVRLSDLCDSELIAQAHRAQQQLAAALRKDT